MRKNVLDELADSGIAREARGHVTRPSRPPGIGASVQLAVVRALVLVHAVLVNLAQPSGDAVDADVVAAAEPCGCAFGTKVFLTDAARFPAGWYAFHRHWADAVEEVVAGRVGHGGGGGGGGGAKSE